MTEQEKDSIYRNYQKKVYFYLIGKGINRTEAEDMCANVFVKFYNSLATYDESKCSPSTWLYHITQNTVIDFYRARKQFGELTEDLVYVDSSFENVLNTETLTELGQALMQLDERSRALVVLVYYEGKTLKESAEKLQISYSNSKIIMKKALESLKKYLGIDLN